VTWSQELLDYAHSHLQRREHLFGARREEVRETLEHCQGDEGLLLSFLYASMPITDVGDYSPEYFLSVVRQALKVREEFSWCGALPEHLFLKDVLYPRINTEELSDCRGLFHDALAPRVAHLPLPEAILEVNRWCCEEATYRSTDGCTSSALEVYRRGYGRCGEESTFLVSALRSVGIAARQIYVPWWSHCDDNHAWVEAFDGERWRYLGACEPEPVLDRGWFTHAAARAMMVHTRSFVQGSREEVAFLFPDIPPVDWEVQEGVAYENLTQRYAKTKLLTVEALDQEGKPLPGAWVSLSVMNMAAPREILRRPVDAWGKVTVSLGEGTVLCTLWDPRQPGLWGEVLLSPEETSCQVRLGQLLAPSGEVSFSAPPDAGLTIPPLSPEAETARQGWLETGERLRQAKTEALHSQKPQVPAGNQGRVWESLTEKDRDRLLSKELLEDAEKAFAWEESLPAQVFQEGLLSPRVGLEVLTPWHRLLADRFSPEEVQAARRNPRLVWKWVETTAPLDEECYQDLWGTPEGMLQVGAATGRGQMLLFCAACRALGIPAKLVDGKPWFWQNGKFSPLWGEEPTGGLSLTSLEDREVAPQRDYTLSRRESTGFHPLRGATLVPGKALELEAVPGEYRLWTVTRMPSGSQLCWWESFSLREGESRNETLTFLEGAPEDLLTSCPLPEFTLEDSQGQRFTGAQLMAKAPLTVLCFLEPNREPTEHLLNELREDAAAFQEVPLYFAMGDPFQEDRTLGLARKSLPGVQLFQADMGGEVSNLARRVYQEPGRLPLVLLVDRKGNSLYSCSGYNVGTAQLLKRLYSAGERLFSKE
jgi:transglutaminase-like putative cysteine protease